MNRPSMYGLEGNEAVKVVSILSNQTATQVTSAVARPLYKRLLCLAAALQRHLSFMTLSVSPCGIGNSQKVNMKVKQTGCI